MAEEAEDLVMLISQKQVTMMKLKVDLDCAKCYKKVKKVLCKFPRELLLSFSLIFFCVDYWFLI